MEVGVLRADAVVALPDAHVEHAVFAKRELRAEVDAARVPVVGDEQVLDVDEGLAVEAAARERRGPFLLLTLRVGQVHELVLRELWMDGDLEQAALTHGEHLRCPGHRHRVERAAADDAQLAGFLRDEDVAVRQEREAPRRRQALEHRHDANGRTCRLDDLSCIGEGKGRWALKATRGQSLPSAALASASRRLLSRASRRLLGRASRRIGEGACRGEGDGRRRCAPGCLFH